MKQRVISALIALIICVPLIYVGKIPFYILALVVAVLGYKEILNLIIKNNILVKIISYLAFVSIISLNIYKTNFNNILDIKILGIIFLLFFIVSLINYKNKNFNISKCLILISYTLFLATAFSSFIIIRNINLNYFIYLFIITITTDTFAQITGKMFGKHKINEISPNKTWEGCIGGSFFGVIIASLFYLTVIDFQINIFLLIVITFFLTIIGQIGDLFFSQIKRHYKIKDFSNIMPGHGGILDRLDSIIFVMLAFTFLINLI
ncbi:MAG: phosphatidate cytidylyltransferase [Bacilli bacterium]